MFRRTTILAVLLFFFFGNRALAEKTPEPLQQQIAERDLQHQQLQQKHQQQHTISIIVMGPGMDLFARFGHIGILVEDNQAKGRKRALVYNYGTFNFDDSDLWLKYAMGYLNYWVSTSTLEWTMRAYTYLDRQLERFTLDIPEDEAAEIAAFLEENIKPENRYFFYRHYFDNCCTRIRDIINRYMKNQLQVAAKQKSGHTFRYWTRESLKNMPIMGFVIDYVLGREIDRPITRWEEYFLPKNFAEDLQNIKLDDGRPLVKEHIVLHSRSVDPPSAHWPLWEGCVFWALIILTILGTIVPVIFAGRKWAKKLFALGLTLWGLLPGLGGLVLLFFLFTQHLDTHWNENILITPMTHLLLLWGARGCLKNKDNLSKRFNIIKYYLLGSSGITLLILLLKLGPLFQVNYGIIITMLISNLWLSLIAIPRLKLDKGVQNVQ